MYFFKMKTLTTFVQNIVCSCFRNGSEAVGASNKEHQQRENTAEPSRKRSGRFLTKLRRFGSRICRRQKTHLKKDRKVSSPAPAEDPGGPVSQKTHPGLRRENDAAFCEYADAAAWSSVKYLGVGSYGYVVLLKSTPTGELAAKKTVDRIVTCSIPVKEAVLHFQLRHGNIVRMFCWKSSFWSLEMFLEYCAGGTLLSALGTLTKEDVWGYFWQLMSGVEYLHLRGVAHRDLKPENLLLAEGKKVLKIADLGLASVFVRGGREVRLNRRVGSLPYTAPEVLRILGRYLGPPVDLWSCGIVLFNMETACMPWRQAAPGDDQFGMWLRQDPALTLRPNWRRLSASARTLLAPRPCQRLSGWSYCSLPL